MKQLLLRAMFIASILVFAASCNDDDDDNNNPTPQPSAVFTAEKSDSLGLSDWVASGVTANIENETILMSAIRENEGDTLTFIILGDEEGIYQIDPQGGIFDAQVAYESPGNPISYTAGASTGSSVITVTTIDTAAQTLSGTFIVQLREFVADDEIAFINGVFENIPYISDIGGGVENVGSISASVDGTVVNFPTVLSSPNPLLDAIVFSGLDADGQSMSFSLPSDVTPGTYQLDPTQLPRATYAPFFDLNNPVNYLSLSGTVTISSHNMNTNEIVGTFSFEAGIIGQAAEHSISDGSFDITYNE